MYETTLQMAGFGGGSSAGGKKGKKNAKKNPPPLTLKPKQQWDRYANLKASTAVRVGVRVVKDGQDDDEANEWLETGKVKSENNESIESAVMMQRGIIAEVCGINEFMYLCHLEQCSCLKTFSFLIFHPIQSIQRDCIHSKCYQKTELNGPFQIL